MSDQRRRELARIHIAAKDAGMDDDTYRAMLWTVARVRSAKDLDQDGRHRVLDHLAGLSGRSRHLGSEAKRALIGGIKKRLRAADRLDAYADGMARHMFNVERFTWCQPDQLRKIVAALEYDAKRHPPRMDRP